MILARLKGGLGNQFFIYAFALYFAEQKKQKVRFDVSSYYKLFKKEYKPFAKQYGIKYELDNFFDYPVWPNLRAKAFFYLAKFNSRKLKISCCFPTVLGDHFDPQHVIESRSYFLNGHYIKRDYTEKIIDKLHIKKLKLTPENEFIHQDIEKQNSVSIHIRGKQYVSNSVYQKTFADINDSYYYDSIKKIKEKIADPKFFVFTNDPEYAKKLVQKRDNDIFFVDTEGPDYEHFYLMSKCKHNIITNSTFSWWAAVLNENKEKIVICPEKWSGEVIVNPYYDELPFDDWIKIKNG